MTKQVIVIDYGMGNLWSIESTFRYLGSHPEITNSCDRIRDADYLVLPGVGSFRKAMQTLRHSYLDRAILEAIRERKAKIIGICLGMQLLGSHSTEGGNTEGLGLIPNQVERFTPQELKSHKIPHIGFNSVAFSERKGLFEDLPSSADFYFVHSYRMLPENLQGRLAICHYGIDFLAGFECGNICGTQFHPEKSQTNGLTLIKNFLDC